MWIPLRVFRQLGIGSRKLGVNVNERIRLMAERTDTSSFSSFIIFAYKGMVSLSNIIAQRLPDTAALKISENIYKNIYITELKSSSNFKNIYQHFLKF